MATRHRRQVIDVKVPFGLARTRRIIAPARASHGTEAAAEAFVDAEPRHLVPRMEWVVPHVFLGKKLGFSAAPDGRLHPDRRGSRAEVTHLSAPCFGNHLAEDLSEDWPTRSPSVLPRAAAERQRILSTGTAMVLCTTSFASSSRSA